MIKLDVDVRPLQRMVDRLNAGYKRTKTTQYRLALSVAEACAELAERRVRVTKTAPDGTPWHAWSASYARTRKSNHSLNVDTKELLRSFEATATPSGRYARVTNSAPHAGYAQGQRPFLGMGRAERSAAEDVALAWLERVV